MFKRGFFLYFGCQGVGGGGVFFFSLDAKLFWFYFWFFFVYVFLSQVRHIITFQVHVSLIFTEMYPVPTAC